MAQIELPNKIEKLQYYRSSKDGVYWVTHPNLNDVVDKINELIDILNGETNDSNS